MKKFGLILAIVSLLSCSSEVNEVDTAEYNEPLVEIADTGDVEISLPLDISTVEDQNDYRIIWHWVDDFSDDEKKKLKKWIRKVYISAQEILGEYPFNMHIYFHRNNRETAVTFGHTKRGPRQSAHFYVNPDYELEEFLGDWIAPHELSHLSMPFVGPNRKWYAEGYATYLSRKVMTQMGYYNAAEFDSLYYSKIRGTLPYYNSRNTFPEVSDSLLDVHEYGLMYWGSTSFFMTSDSLLREKHNMKLTEVIFNYQPCCRLKDENLSDIMASYDQLINDTLFTHLLWRYENLPSSKVMEGY